MAVLVLVGEEVDTVGELVMLMSPGPDVAIELEVVEAGPTALSVALT